jgi:hypothetical protein
MSRNRPTSIELFNFIVSVFVALEILVGAASFVLASQKPLLRWLAGGAVVLGLGALVFVGKLRRLSHVFTHIHDVIAKFSIPSNVNAWREVRERYRYMGISGNTIEMQLRSFLAEEGLPEGSIAQFLLMMPFSEYVKQTKRHEMGDGELEENIIQEAEATSRRIEDVSRAYLSLSGPKLRVEVRFYSQYLGYWAHLVDETEAFVGYMFKGQPGLNATVIHLKRAMHEDNLLRRFFADEFERIWESAEPAQKYFARKDSAFGSSDSITSHAGG